MKKAVLLLNLGTPAAPTAAGLRRFYRRFFADPFVFDMNPLGRWLLRNLIIMPLRAPKTARQYAAIWTEEGSPLKVYTDRLQAAMQTAFDAPAGDEGIGGGAMSAKGGVVYVRVGMAYSEPSIPQAMAELGRLGCREILLLPLFPQYSTATTASVFHAVKEAAKQWREAPAMKFVDALCYEPPFIQAWADLIARHLDGDGDHPASIDGHHLIFSYHGLPESAILKADAKGCCTFGDCCDTVTADNRLCYRAQCFATTRSIIKALNRPHLSVDLSAAAHAHQPDIHSDLRHQPGYSIAFQSRFGRQRWIQPYLDEHLAILLEKGIRRVAVVTPSFVSDCLETLHEIGIEYRDQFLNNGGESFLLLPNLNAHPPWHQALTHIAVKHLRSVVY